MKKWIREAIIIICIVLLFAVAWAAYTNLGGVNSTTGEYRLGGTPIVKTLNIAVDSLGVDHDVAVWTWERNVTVLRVDFFARSNAGTNADSVIISSGSAERIVLTVASGAAVASSVTDVDFSADACTVRVDDGAAGTGGVTGNLVIQFTDKL